MRSPLIGLQSLYRDEAWGLGIPVQPGLHVRPAISPQVSIKKHRSLERVRTCPGGTDSIGAAGIVDQQLIEAKLQVHHAVNTGRAVLRSRNSFRYQPYPARLPGVITGQRNQ